MEQANENAKPALVVLAAGMGSRYGGLKQMDPVGPGGETVLDYSVYDARRAGFGKVVFVIRRDFATDFEERIVRPLEGTIDVRCAFQALEDLPGGRLPPAGRRKPWGTAHAIWCAREEIEEPFAVINADDFYGAGAFRALASFFRETPADTEPPACALAAYRLADTLSSHGPVARGVLETSSGDRLTGIREVTGIESEAGRPVSVTDEGRRGLDPDALVSMNCWGFDPRLLPYFEERLERFLEKHGDSEKREFYVADPVENALREGKATFRVLSHSGRWFGVTYREEKPDVIRAIAALVAEGEYPEKLKVKS